MSEHFRQAIRERFGVDPGPVIADGFIHRFSTKSTGRDDAGWYIFHDDDMPAGMFGCWRSGISETWSSRAASSLSPVERIAQHERAKRMAYVRDAELGHRHAVGAAKASQRWEQAKPADAEHPYLKNKGVVAHFLRQSGDRLVVPVRIDGALTSLQFIGPDGDKKFLTDGAVSGGYCAIGSPEDVLVVAEGYATGASIHAATGHAVAVAFNARNLTPVAQALRLKFPSVRIVVAGDDDFATEGNPGVTAAKDAARAAGGAVVLPPFDRNDGDVGTDWNDFAASKGPQAVRAAFEPVVTVARNEPLKPPMGTVVLTRASDVVSEPIDWLWPQYLARGKFHLLGGSPSAGKTTLACRLAATISSSGTFPSGYRAEAGNVLIWSGEDSIADTLKPRLDAAGANLDRILFVAEVSDKDGPRAFDPARDIANLERAIQQLGDVALLILDPVVSAVAGDGHKSNDVRRALQPLVDMAGRHKIATIGITHFSKGTSGRDPTERITGSIAFGALARIVLVVAKEDNGQGQIDAPAADMRIFTRAKSNVGPDGGGFYYSVENVELHGGITTSKVVWGAPLTGSARDLLGQAESEANSTGDSGALAEAKEFLLDELGNGPVPVKELERSAAEAGISKATLRRAYEKVGVDKRRAGFGSDGGWIRFIPGLDAKGDHQNPKALTPERLSTFGENEHLWADGAEIEL